MNNALKSILGERLYVINSNIESIMSHITSSIMFCQLNAESETSSTGDKNKAKDLEKMLIDLKSKIMQVQSGCENIKFFIDDNGEIKYGAEHNENGAQEI